MPTKWTYRKDYTPHPFQITDAYLAFSISEKSTTVCSRLTVKKIGLTDVPLVLHGENLTLKEIFINEQPLPDTAYTYTSDTLTLTAVPDKFVLETIVEVHPDENLSLEGLYRSGDMLCTQNEPEGFRKITYFIDRPDNLTRFRTRIEADFAQYPVLLSNGNKVGEGKIGTRHYTEWEDPFPKPSYLFALVAGKFDVIRDTHVTAFSKKTVSLEIFVDPGYKQQAYFAMESLKRAMAWDEIRFGLEYDLDLYMIVAAQAFNMGAMENKGLNLFNAKYVLADTESATDSDYIHIESVIGHEYFHNWTGNRVTCRDWFQLTLKEGLTVFRDEEFTADCHSRTVKRIQDVRYLRDYQFGEDASPLAHPIQPDKYKEINNFYTATVYNKGAEVIRMLHTFLGEENFQKGIANYLTTNDGTAATTDDFLRAFVPYSPIDLGEFAKWYHQVGTPKCQAVAQYDARTKTYTLTLTQIQPTASAAPLLMPVIVGLLDQTGLPLSFTYQEKNTETCTLHFSETTQSFTFTDVQKEPIPSLFRNFSAPILCEYPYSISQRTVLMGSDPDSFNRFESCEALMIDMVNTYLQTPSTPSVSFLKAFGQLLEHIQDPEFIAETLAFPSISRLSDVLGRTDFSALSHARSQLMAQIAQTHAPRLRTIAERDIQSTTWRASDVGARRLRLVCLGYLRFAGCDYLDLIYHIFKHSHTMTEKIGTLGLLCHHPSAETNLALAQFEDAWIKNPLVMQKWFGVQANADHPTVIETVQKLLSHPAMDIKNPNFIRALVGTFSYNLPYFHQENGEGYRLVANTIGKLDTQNPQIAARLAKRFQDIHKLSTMQQTHIKNAFASFKKLSKDTEEILGSLGIL